MLPAAARSRILERGGDVPAHLQAAASKLGIGPSPFHTSTAEYLLTASPAAVSLFHRVRQNLEQYGLGVTQHMLDAMTPGVGTGGMIECAREGE